MSAFKAAIMVLALAACAQPAATEPPTPVAPGQVAAGEDQLCGGVAGISCGDGLYCRYDGGHCGATDQSGTCRVRPTAATLDLRPVCGCDGRTYPNASSAAVAGVSVASNGGCTQQTP